MWHGTSNKFITYPSDKTYGLALAESNTVGVIIYALLQLLSLPRQLRRTNAYAAKLVCIIPRDSLKTVPLSPSGQRYDSNDFNWTQVAKASMGLELQWKPFIREQQGWLADYFQNVITFGLGFIPGIGFILQIGFSLGWTALTDRENFYEVLKANIPAVLLTDGLIRTLNDDAGEVKLWLPKNWDGLGKPFQLPSTQSEQGVDTTDKTPSEGLAPTGEAESFVKASKVLAKSATTTPPLVTVNL